MPDGTTTQQITPTAERRRVVLAGFYGRGNAGDEALLQCLYEAFSDEFDITIAVDQHGAYPGFWDWYPYQGNQIIHQTEQSYFNNNKTLAGLVIGGGGLPLGFCANLMVGATANRTPTLLSGIDTGNDWVTTRRFNPRFMKMYRDMYSFLMVRTEYSHGNAEKARLDAFYGADLALRLQADQDPGISYDGKRALIVVREWPQWRVDGKFVPDIQRIVDQLERKGYTPVFLPFAPEDTRFVKEMEIDRLAPVEECWWNARRLKQLIANSGMLISVGRLHPVIFAATTETPTASVASPIATGYRTIYKVPHMCAELGQQHYDDVPGLLDAIDEGAIRRADPEKVSAARARLDEALEKMRAIMRPPRVDILPKKPVVAAAA